MAVSRRLLLKQSLLGPALFARPDFSYSTRAIDLVRRSTVIDMLGLLTLDYRKFASWGKQPDLFGHADLERLKACGITIFHPAVGFVSGDIYTQSLADLRRWNAFVDAYPNQFLRIERASQFRGAKEHGKIGILLGQQNSAHFRTVDDVDRFYLLGQRVSQLTYHGNRIGGGSSDAVDSGLTQYGLQIIDRMNTLGMAIDVSHCGDKTTLQAIEASRKPVLVTHSNCRALCPAARCKPDEAIKQLAAKGGVIGITMVRGFVGGRATIEDVLNHIDHVTKLVGVEHVGIGTDVDLDGRDRAIRRFDLDGIDYANKIYDLTEGLLARNYAEKDIELILGGNFERVLAQTWAA